MFFIYIYNLNYHQKQMLYFTEIGTLSIYIYKMEILMCV